MPDRQGPRQTVFDVWSRFYDLEGVQRAIYRPVQDAVVAELRHSPPSRVLDIGCGTGILSTRLRDEFGEVTVVGCDFSAGMLEQAAQRGREVAWVRGDALHLPLGDGSVDAVVSTESFHWFPDHDAALAEFRRVLVAGGRLLVALVNPRLASTSRAIERGLGDAASWPTRREMRDRVTAAGFVVVRQQRIVRIAGLIIPTVLTVAERRPSR